MTLQRPFQHLNLRYNPFGERTSAQRTELAVVDGDHIAGWLAFLQQDGPLALQFKGPCGRGKSTHMLKLHSHFPDAPLVRVRPEETPHIPDAPFLFVDGVDLLGWWKRWTLFRRVHKLVLTTHDIDYVPTLEKKGFVCQSAEVKITRPEQLRPIFEARIEAARREEGPIPSLPDETLQALFDQFGDDIRSMEWKLYDLFQALEEPTDVKM